MNKKQLIAAWVTVVLICLIILFAPKDYLVYSGGGRINRVEPTDQFAHRAIVKIKWDRVVQRSLIILFLGAMAIYTLSEEKKKESIKKTIEVALKSKSAARKTATKKRTSKPRARKKAIE